MIQFDDHIFEMVWFNHQLEKSWCDGLDRRRHPSKMTKSIVGGPKQLHDMKFNDDIREAPTKVNHQPTYSFILCFCIFFFF